MQRGKNGSEIMGDMKTKLIYVSEQHYIDKVLFNDSSDVNVRSCVP